MEAYKNNYNKIVKGSITSLLMLLALYFTFSINTISVAAKTVSGSANEYTLLLQERGGIQEQIKGSDINLKYDSSVQGGVIYDEGLLQASVNKLSCFDSSKVIISQNASLVYSNYSYSISREVYGNNVNRNILYSNIVKAIKNKDKTLDLEALKCYDGPYILSDSPGIINARDTLNRYVSAKITYIFAGNTWYLDGSQIQGMVGIDGNGQTYVDEAAVRNYVDRLANAYTSLLGKGIKVSGGYDGNNHSWVIDSAAETRALIENIKSGQTITKHPIYAQKSSASYFSSVGENFVEIDMTKQHLWFYKDGYLVVEGDVVTGNVSAGNATPTGVYKLYSKEKDSVLRGEDYAVPVSFWMPFNRNIGLHDASWRTVFGGEIYKTDGSHGCINLPYYVAEAIYKNITIGVPVICYYS